MRKRVGRAEQAGLNRDQVLAAAKRVFLARGYEGATLDAIAQEAGFSKGVVYSQFESKADLFLALLERRIDERAAQNEAIAKRLSGADAVAAIFRAGNEDGASEVEWGLLLLEFRLHAARSPQLNRRYAEAHRRTIGGVASVLEQLFAEAGDAPPETPRQLAALVLALAPGLLLERAADARAIPRAVAERAFARLVGLRAGAR